MNRGGKWLVALAAAGATAVLVVALAHAADAGPQQNCPFTYESFGKAFLDQYCLRCHVSTKTSAFARGGAPIDANYDETDRLRRDKAGILKLVVDKKKMPPDDPKPEDAERAKLKAWIECEFK